MDTGCQDSFIVTDVLDLKLRYIKYFHKVQHDLSRVHPTCRQTEAGIGSSNPVTLNRESS